MPNRTLSALFAQGAANLRFWFKPVNNEGNKAAVMGTLRIHRTASYGLCVLLSRMVWTARIEASTST